MSMDPLANILNIRANNLFQDDTSVPVTIITTEEERIPITPRPQEDTDILLSSMNASRENEGIASQDAHPTELIDVDSIKQKIYHIKDELDGLLRMLESNPTISQKTSRPSHLSLSDSPPIITESGEKIIEGFFDGEKMIGPDGHEYAVPPNYASKSKIVEGDRMKLTITREGRFIYKQIGPVPRKRIIGTLLFDTVSQLWSVSVENDREYKILTASATFYRAKPGDEVIILVHEEDACSWGAVDNVMRK